MELLLPNIDMLPISIQNMIREVARDPLSNSAEIDAILEDAQELIQELDTDP